MCNEAVEEDPYMLKFVPDPPMTQKMCGKAAWGDPFSLQYVPDWFVTQGQLKIWHDNDDYCNDDELIEWYDGYKKRKAQKFSIKKKLMPTAWHPNCMMDWCMSQDEKRWWK